MRLYSDNFRIAQIVLFDGVQRHDVGWATRIHAVRGCQHQPRVNEHTRTKPTDAAIKAPAANQHAFGKGAGLHRYTTDDSRDGVGDRLRLPAAPFPRGHGARQLIIARIRGHDLCHLINLLSQPVKSDSRHRVDRPAAKAVASTAARSAVMLLSVWSHSYLTACTEGSCLDGSLGCTPCDEPVFSMSQQSLKNTASIPM